MLDKLNYLIALAQEQHFGRSRGLRRYPADPSTAAAPGSTRRCAGPSKPSPRRADDRPELSPSCRGRSFGTAAFAETA